MAFLRTPLSAHNASQPRYAKRGNHPGYAIVASRPSLREWGERSGYSERPRRSSHPPPLRGQGESPSRPCVIISDDHSLAYSRPTPPRPQSDEKWLVWLHTNPSRGVAPPRRV
eukprot:6195295-Pleurochrysis_carterae.AAC.4